MPVDYSKLGLGIKSGDRPEAQKKIAELFSVFGYEPSEEEINAFTSVFAAKGGGTRANTAIANYVQAARAQQERKKNDPLNQVISDERGFFTDSERKAADFQEQGQAEQKRLEESITSAPKLFGSLTPEQIDQYLAPVDRAASERGSNLAGDFNRRGITGSSSEANALADNERQFKENVLGEGLKLGLTLKDIQTGVISSNVERLDRTGSQFRGFLPGSLARQGQIATSQSEMAFDESRFLSELPIYLRGLAAQEAAIDAAIEQAERNKKKKTNFAGLAGTVAGAVIGGVATGGNPAGVAVGSNIGGQFGNQFDTNQGGGSAIDLSGLLALQRQRSSTPTFRGGSGFSTPVDPGTATV